MTLADLLPRLEAVRPRGTGRYTARCPAHSDRSPSLSVSEGERGALLRCWAGCTLDEICGALGIRPADLFFDTQRSPLHRPVIRPVLIDQRKVAFEFEAAALDRRLRAETVLAAASGLQTHRWTDQDFDRAIHAVERAHDDLERAALFEALADSLRWKDFIDRRGEKHAGRNQAA